MKVGGKSMIAKVCEAARNSGLGKVVVVWAHKFPHLTQTNVLGRFQETVKKHQPDTVIRLTSDCPLLTSIYIYQAYVKFKALNDDYYSNHLDGYDVQVFKPEVLWTKGMTDTEHVISDYSTKRTGLSVDTLEDLERVRKICETK